MVEVVSTGVSHMCDKSTIHIHVSVIIKEIFSLLIPVRSNELYFWMK